MTLTEAWNGTYTAQIYGLGYHQNPFRDPDYSNVTYTLEDGDAPRQPHQPDLLCPPRCNILVRQYRPPLSGDTLTAHVSWIQQEISIPVLFPWEEVTDP